MLVRFSDLNISMLHDHYVHFIEQGKAGKWDFSTLTPAYWSRMIKVPISKCMWAPEATNLARILFCSMWQRRGVLRLYKETIQSSPDMQENTCRMVLTMVASHWETVHLGMQAMRTVARHMFLQYTDTQSQTFTGPIILWPVHDSCHLA